MIESFLFWRECELVECVSMAAVGSDEYDMTLSATARKRKSIVYSKQITLDENNVTPLTLPALLSGRN